MFSSAPWYSLRVRWTIDQEIAERLGYGGFDLLNWGETIYDAFTYLGTRDLVGLTVVRINIVVCPLLPR